MAKLIIDEEGLFICETCKGTGEVKNEDFELCMQEDGVPYWNFRDCGEALNQEEEPCGDCKRGVVIDCPVCREGKLHFIIKEQLDRKSQTLTDEEIKKIIKAGCIATGIDIPVGFGNVSLTGFKEIIKKLKGEEDGN